MRGAGRTPEERAARLANPDGILGIILEHIEAVLATLAHLRALAAEATGSAGLTFVGGTQVVPILAESASDQVRGAGQTHLIVSDFALLTLISDEGVVVGADLAAGDTDEAVT